MIKTLSPYYIDIPFVSPLSGLTCSQFTLKIYIWKGLKTDIPILSSYEITKTNPEQLTTNTKINISNLVSPFLEFVPKVVTSNQLVGGDNQTWVKTSVFYTTTNITERNTAQIQSTKIAVKGFSYGMEGENKETPADRILMQGREFKVGKNSTFIVPIEILETVVPPPDITITSVVLNAGNDYDVFFTSVGTYTNFQCIISKDGEDPVLQIMDGITSPQLTTITFTGSVGVQMFGYDSASGQNIFSNIFPITI